MALRELELKDGEFYHIYNRGVDKRIVFKDRQDFFQFIQMLDHFNQKESLGGMEKYKYPKNIEKRGQKSSLLVEIIAYCLNKNHYHLILKQVADDGISRFMQRIGTGYTMYFNQKYKRTGSLFGGRFKSKYIPIERLNYSGVYVNLNNKIHQKHQKQEQRGSTSLLAHVSSWNEYMGKSKLKLCKKDYLLIDFKNADSYKKFAEETLKDIIENRKRKKDLDLDLDFGE